VEATTTFNKAAFKYETAVCEALIKKYTTGVRSAPDIVVPAREELWADCSRRLLNAQASGNAYDVAVAASAADMGKRMLRDINVSRATHSQLVSRMVRGAVGRRMVLGQEMYK
jgi:hypothetical protein